jgi:predicted NAD/FAD-binding protein
MILQINRFNSEAMKALKSSPEFQDHTLGEYVRKKIWRRFSEFLSRADEFRCLVHAAGIDAGISRRHLLRFFHNHGFLGLHTQHPWFTVVNGAKSYVEKSRAVREKIRLQKAAGRVVRENGGVCGSPTEAGVTETFDHVIFASHADETLKNCWPTPTMLERALLGEFKYQPNLATLHTDVRDARGLNCAGLRGTTALIATRTANFAFDGLLDEPFAGCFRAAELFCFHQRRKFRESKPSSSVFNMNTRCSTWVPSGRRKNCPN